jgi:hypothetical protein
MGTRSTIALEFADGTVQSVYCHWDGYLEHNGKILLEHYSDPFKLRDLIDLGGLSSLRPNVGEKHAFSQFEVPDDQVEAFKALTEDMCTFYARDRGEELVIDKWKDIEDYYANVYGEEYDYILSMNWAGKAQWYVRFYATEGNWIPLEMAFKQMKEEEDYEL